MWVSREEGSKCDWQHTDSRRQANRIIKSGRAHTRQDVSSHAALSTRSSVAAISSACICSVSNS